MNNLLTRGAIAAIFEGQTIKYPVLQLLACKKMNTASSHSSGKTNDRYRLMLSDGEHTCTAMLNTQLNEMVSTGKLDVQAAMKVNDYTCSKILNNDRRVIVVLDLEIVKKGSEIGMTIGTPSPWRTPGQGAGPGPVQQQSRPTSYGTTGAAPSSSRPNGTKQQGSFYGQSNQAVGSNISPKKVHPISSLTPYQNRWTIKVRVTNKSKIRTWSNARGEGKLFSMDLSDQSGEIRCTAFKDTVDKYYDMIEIGKIYYVSRGTLKPANRQYTSINNDYELTFNNDTMVEPCVEEDVSIPAVQFDFKSIAHLEDTAEDSMIDVIGVCKSTSDLASVTIKSSNREVNKRSIQLVDDSQKEVSLTLWGKEAEEFDGSGNPVIAVKGARLSGFGGRSLSVLQSSIFQVNPDIPKAHHLKGWFDSEGHSQDSQSISSKMGGGGGSNTNWLNFHDVHAQNLGQGEKPDYFTVKGTILFVRKENCMYMACPSAECNKKVSENGDGSYRCEKCAKDYEGFKYRLLLSANVADATDNQWITCFQETAEQLLNKQAQELGSLKDQGEATEREYNQVFQDACFNDYMFKMRIKMETYNEEARLKCTCVNAQPINVRDYTKKLINDIRLMASA
ncbi:replication protein A 70 kDa DNA-binding subunit-like isoform X1 [Lytechinus variegatus]|uniref:replication protein A 70 kDa DNA-binding subunit-like isoform X1 n=1 Tax=Lytechinus variegatus TaxID=7654 RepID=UPI001BB22440|nr:replication protein A 70 kDa DNA-binding subunit-like isoform X1 [Lytechinus variegatus]